MKERRVEFYSEGIKLVGTVYLPDDYQEGTKLPCVIPCSGITGLNAVYPALYARHFTKRGYACLGFDFRGWAPSEGRVGYTTIEGQYQDILAAYLFAQQQPEIDPNNIGLFGWGFSAPIVIMVAADYPEIKAVSCGNGFYNGRNAALAVPPYADFLELEEITRKDMVKRVLTGDGDYTQPGWQMYKQQHSVSARNTYQNVTLTKVSPDIENVLMRDYGGRENFPPAQSWAQRESIMRVKIERYLPDVAPRGLFLCGSRYDRVYPYTETLDCFRAAGEGRVLYTVEGDHNDWMFDDDPRFLDFIEAMVKFFDSYLK